MMKSLAPTFSRRHLIPIGREGWIMKSLFDWIFPKREMAPSAGRTIKVWGLLGNIMRFFIPLMVVGGLVYYFVIWKSERTGSIRVISDIPGAEILIDGSTVGLTTDTTIANIPVGKVTVSVQKRGYQPNPPFEVVNLRSGRIPEISFQMEEQYLTEFYQGVPVREKETPVPTQIYDVLRPPRKPLPSLPIARQPAAERPRKSQQVLGSIIVSANEKDAEILLNGRPTGSKTNATLEDVPQGSYSVSVVKDGYIVDPPEVAVSIERDLQNELVVFNLRPAKETPTPHLKVTTDPVPGQIFVNGRPVGSGQYESNMEMGKYLIAFGSIPGYFDPTPQEVILSEDNPRVNITGTYLKAKGKAMLAILRPEKNGVIEGARLKVMVDEDPYFISPGGQHNGVLIDHLVQGRHRIQIDYEGKSEEIDLTLSDNSITMVSFRIDRFLNFKSMKLINEGTKNVGDWEKYSKNLDVLAVE
jgi:hypothetical protein